MIRVQVMMNMRLRVQGCPPGRGRVRARVEFGVGFEFGCGFKFGFGLRLRLVSTVPYWVEDGWGCVYKVNVTMSVLPIGYTRRCPFGTRCETQPACEVRFWGQNYLGLGLLVERTNQRSSSVRFQSVPVRVTRTLTRTVAQRRSQSAPWPG